MGQFLIVTVQAPFPARNGVTLPAAALAAGLQARGHSVEVAWLRGPGTDPEGGEETARSVSRIHEVQAIPRSLVSRAVGELALGRPGFDRWRLGRFDPSAVTRPDLIWATPRSCVNPSMRLRDRAGWHGVPVVAAVNDAWTGVLANRGRPGPVRWLRRALMARAERSLLSQPDGVVVQSDHDARVLVNALGLPAAAVHVLANGADDSLFDLPMDRPRAGVGWVGDARHAHYGAGVRRFIEEVWPAVEAARPGLSLHLSGPGTEALSDDGDLSIHNRGFVADLKDVYAPLSVLVAPVFKGHGRINKVVEAMASGVPVVGDPTAFHGIEEFEPGRHGVVVDGWGEFGSVLAGLLDDEARLEAVAADARGLAQAHFRWSDRLDTVEQWLSEGL